MQEANKISFKKIKQAADEMDLSLVKHLRNEREREQVLKWPINILKIKENAKSG